MMLILVASSECQLAFRRGPIFCAESQLDKKSPIQVRIRFSSVFAKGGSAGFFPPLMAAPPVTASALDADGLTVVGWSAISLRPTAVIGAWQLLFDVAGMNL
jgi:hypothetical protein